MIFNIYQKQHSLIHTYTFWFPVERICNEAEWQCVDGSGCVHSDYLCDGSKDCNDNSDEAGCQDAEGILILTFVVCTDPFKIKDPKYFHTYVWIFDGRFFQTNNLMTSDVCTFFHKISQLLCSMITCFWTLWHPILWELLLLESVHSSISELHHLFDLKPSISQLLRGGGVISQIELLYILIGLDKLTEEFGLF